MRKRIVPGKVKVSEVFHVEETLAWSSRHSALQSTA